MALVFSGLSTCPVCDRVFQDTDDLVLFPHFIVDEAHSLWRFSDSAMHRKCFTSWEHGPAFRDAFHRLWPDIMPGHPREMKADGTIVKLDAGVGLGGTHGLTNLSGNL